MTRQQQAAKAAITTPGEREIHSEERDGMLASGMEGGLNETSARFDELLARLAVG
jgi:hypothetical protein